MYVSCSNWFLINYLSTKICEGLRLFLLITIVRTLDLAAIHRNSCDHLEVAQYLLDNVRLAFDCWCKMIFFCISELDDEPIHLMLNDVDML